MAKNKKVVPTPHAISNTASVKTKPANEELPKPSDTMTITGFRMQAIIIAILGFVLYANTFRHSYAFDDMMAIVNNEYVQEGVAGIPDIMSKDAFESYLQQRNGSNQLSGGRYRPLSLITFAVEQQMLGVNDVEEMGPNAQARNNDAEEKMESDMHFRHVVNVLLFILSMLVLLYFLRMVVFPGQPLLAFITVALFTAHPIHTEVVANVKSRDEILSILFISLTFIKAFKYRETSKVQHAVWSCIYFFFALLSKEYAVTLVALLPLSFFIFNKEGVGKSLKGLLPYLIPLGLYFALRTASVSGPAEGADKDIMNYPYLFASGAQKLASELAVLLRYIKLLFIPYPLAADYSYNQLPYSSFSNPLVWLSVAIHLAMVGAMVFYTIRRHVVGFALAFYLLNLALISNILFNIGAPMGERLVYHSSLGFCIIIAMAAYAGYEKIAKDDKEMKGLLAGVGAVVLLFAGLTIMRNGDWKDNNTLFLKDVATVPNSARVNSNAGAACMAYAKEAGPGQARDEWFKKAIGYFNKTISINPNHGLARLNRGLCYFNSGYAERGLADWDSVRRIAPATAQLGRYLKVAGGLFQQKAGNYASRQMTDSAIYCFRLSIQAIPDDGKTWAGLGAQYMVAGKYVEASAALNEAVKLLPGNVEVKNMYNDATARAGK